jgi:hypothetical protein
MYRLLLLAIVAIGLAPGTLIRTPTGLRSDVAVVTITPVTAREGVEGALTLTGAWELSSAHGWFGGFSALVASGPDSVIAGSDRGWLLDLDLSGTAPAAVPGSFRFIGQRVNAREEIVDLEALARDPATGTLWAAFENFNLVTRIAADGTRANRKPPAMRDWSMNSGPETMVRLADGRFLIIAEGEQQSGRADRPALLFAGDPLASPRPPLAFRFLPEPGYDPVDATQLPDGRMLILLRRVTYAIPAEFSTAIALADPAAIRPGKPWRARLIQRLSGEVFGDNFEGIAFIPDPANPARGAVWVIADDNFSAFQRNLLVRFRWNGPTPRPTSPTSHQ